jgi:hypothetical protein
VFSYHRLFGLPGLDMPVVLFHPDLSWSYGLSDIHTSVCTRQCTVRARNLKSQVVIHRTDEAGYLLGQTGTFDVVHSQHSPFPQGNSGLDARFIFRPVWNPKFHDRLRKSPSQVSVMSQLSPAHSLIFCDECIHF